MIELTKLSKRFGPIVAVDGVSLCVEPGEVLGFLGPNGAGKSTTMKMITGFLSPTSGSVSVCGHSATEEPLALKRCIGYLPEGAPAYPDMTPAAFLNFIAEVRQIPARERRKRIDEVRSLVHLEGVMHQPIETLSKGYKRRVGLAQAILHDPRVLILDEPTDGLDPNQKHEVRQLIRDMASSGARKVIVLSTHILEEVETVCSRAVVIARGRVVADETPNVLQARSAMHNAVTLGVEGAVGGFADLLAKLPKVARVETLDCGEESLRCRVYAKGGQLIVSDVRDAAIARSLRVIEVRVESGRLDEVFRTITTGGAA
ncbi:MAG: ABC transporter ATP-binding protein [Phycisphaeraceae bacterium]|nr:ABC transporter ATP-binding protein [Phycisphaeraceae bacterium]MCW5763835.1 ABC transporter ATP-binding protein [Phycisphaeraceae bacterium]